jgi:hypothetical protein
MIITPVDSQLDLFIVEDVLPADLLTQINNEDLWSYPWEKQNMQAAWDRRLLQPESESPLGRVDNYYNQLLDQIADAVNIEFEHKSCWSSFWLDYENYSCSIHEDGAERGYTPLLAMQVYLTESADNLGTVWYLDAEGKHIRHAFPYKQNTGYLMLNHAGQWHGMLNKVPANHLRLSSYTYFGKFYHK